MIPSLLDTNTISDIIRPASKRRPTVAAHASDYLVESQRQGHVVGDCDLIIAATAQFYDLGLATSNTKHFDWIGGLQLFDWRQP